MRKINITQFHIERSQLEIVSPEFHPLALAIKDHLRSGLYALADDSRIEILTKLNETKYIVGLPRGDKLYWPSKGPSEFTLHCPPDLLIPESEVGFYRLHGCSRTDIDPEIVRMNFIFHNIRDRNDFWRLVFAMRKSGLKYDLLTGIGKMFFDLGKGLSIFPNPDPPPGYEPMMEVAMEAANEVGEDFKFPNIE